MGSTTSTWPLLLCVCVSAGVGDQTSKDHRQNMNFLNQESCVIIFWKQENLSIECCACLDTFVVLFGCVMTRPSTFLIYATIDSLSYKKVYKRIESESFPSLVQRLVPLV